VAKEEQQRREKIKIKNQKDVKQIKIELEEDINKLN